MSKAKGVGPGKARFWNDAGRYHESCLFASLSGLIALQHFLLLVGFGEYALVHGLCDISNEPMEGWREGGMKPKA